MKKTKLLNSGINKKNAFTYILVILSFAVVEILKMSGGLKASARGMLVPICAYIVMALSLNLTVGILGELSLGHAGFMSIGAYSGVTVAMVLGEKSGIAPLPQLIIAIIVGTIVGGVFGFLIGIPVLKLKGDYLAIVTLAFGEIIKNLINNCYVAVDGKGVHFAFLNNNMALDESGKNILQGAMGIKNIPRIATFEVGVVLIIISLFVIFNFTSSRIGRSIMAIRDNRIAAESIGLPVAKYKMIAFVISAAIAGAAGGLYGMNYSTLMPSKFGFNQSILILVFVVLGGQGNMLGSVIAAAALTILPEALRQFSDYRMLVYAIVLILFMLISHNPTVNNLVFKFKQKLAGKKRKEAQ